MDLQNLERIIKEEVSKVIAERERNEAMLLPPNQNETLDAFACNGPTCSMPTSTSASSVQATVQPTPNITPQPSTPAQFDKTADGPAILHLFTGAREKWDILAGAFASWHGEGVRLDAIFSNGAKEVISVDDVAALGFRMIDRPDEIREIIYDLSRYDAIFLPAISRTHAAKLALGITDNLTLNMSISALAQKIPTFASSDGLDPTDCPVCGNNVPGIQDVLSKYREHLGTMGMKLLPAEDVIQRIDTMILNKTESGPDLITSLITEEDALQLNGPVIKVSRGGLITPLALESLSQRGIEVVIVPQN